VLTLHDPALARRYYDEGFWQGDTLYSLLDRNVRRRPNERALQDSARKLSWLELGAWVDTVAARLRDSSLSPGDRVSFQLSNRVEGVVTMLACDRDGLIANPSLHRSHTSADVASLVRQVGSRCLIAEDGWCGNPDGPDALKVSLEIPAISVRWRLPASRTAVSDFPRGERVGTIADPDENPDKVCYLAFTSGTTGAPKGVMHSDNTLLANARDLVADWRLGPEDVVLPLSPLSHHIFWVAMAQALLTGATMVLNDPPKGASPLDLILATGATYVLGVPTHAIDILAEQKRRDLDHLGQVRVFYMAGAPIPSTVARAFVSQGVTPQNVYGMTENSSHNYTRPDDDEETICGTNGKPGSSYEVRFFDPADSNREVLPGEVGEIGGRGACLMLGYFGDQSATERVFNREGWFLSGDLGYADSRGNLVFSGRLKDLIIRGGHNIHPAPIEEMAMRHGRVYQSAAIPLRDERLGERVCLAIVASGDPPTAREMLAYLEQSGLSRYEMPEYFLVVDAFPLTASGKVLKRELVALCNSGKLVPEVLFETK
jgi:acyl-CoA synthetase